MHIRRSLLASTGVILALGLFSADARAQYYLGAEGGWTSLASTKNTFSGFPNKRTYNDGFNVGARGGYQLGPWRFEEEYNYRENGNHTAQLGALIGSKISGDRHSNAIMTNAIYDYDGGWAVTPHVGGGIGAVELHDSLKLATVGRVSNSSDWQFGYQAIAGIRYNITPAVAFDLDYRYFATTDGTFHSTPFKVGAVTVPSVKYGSGYSTHNLVASITYKFMPPALPIAAPPPPPPPPVAARQVFMVFFDWDKATITREGMQVVQQAAAAYKAGAPVRLMVTGYTDRSGSPGYNQRLSERRANNVANALAAAGVVRSDMTVSGRGESDNRVPTADGVREPQNRRVEIVPS